ncbi:hypothetical protein BKA81DRAFT_173252 [Phyllosticta paracitricarpa]
MKCKAHVLLQSCVRKVLARTNVDCDGILQERQHLQQRQRKQTHHPSTKINACTVSDIQGSGFVLALSPEHITPPAHAPQHQGHIPDSCLRQKLGDLVLLAHFSILLIILIRLRGRVPAYSNLQSEATYIITAFHQLISLGRFMACSHPHRPVLESGDSPWSQHKMSPCGSTSDKDACD